MNRTQVGRCLRWTAAMAVVCAAALAPALGAQQAPAACERVVEARVVALDQIFFWNRLGAVEPQGMIFALERDVVSKDGSPTLTAGNVELREGKRPRPMVLRMDVGDCLVVHFRNLLNPVKVDNEQPATRNASVHVVGMQLVNDIADDGSFVGQNASSLVAPGGSRDYEFYAEREGGFVLYSGHFAGGEGDGGQISAGLFGAVNVQPRHAEWYRSQVTAADMALATIAHTTGGQPILNYDAVYPPGHPQAGIPILNMLDGNEIVHSDLTAIITGPNRGLFPPGTYPPNPQYPRRDEPFREYTIIFHDEFGAVQAFNIFNDPVFVHTTHSGRDAFAINYGTGGIGAEILANRFGVGPMFDCTECKYEEFFLSAWAVGDPAMVVDVPANAPCDPEVNVDAPEGAPFVPCTPDPGPKATVAFFPDDPSNVYHSYIQDHVKFRNLHAGSDDHHIFHLHAHQWVHTPDSDKSTYLDSQAIGQGSAFTYEAVYNGSGNRNQTVGDAIFHCHFYPHFAQGMWALWRNHDVFETGTELDEDGRAVAGTRALPDAEILAGTPIPALVPIPGLAMAPMPQAQAEIQNGQAVVTGVGNPGFPFFIPAVAGHRPPHPPLDTLDDGGLPRHVITSGTTFHVETRLDFTKELINVQGKEIPENGSFYEQQAMQYHGVRLHPSFTTDGTPANYVTNGNPPAPGAPYAEPCIDDFGNLVGSPRLYKAADIQMDVILNKSGWHFPQQRFISLWEDVNAFKFGNKPPEPLFFRANTDDCITYQLTNLVPNIYELDDFQVRTPTDVLGQHIHLVKFDVTSSDGAANGWNYEDGSFSPDEVRERINAINAGGGLLLDNGSRVTLQAVAHPFFGPGPDENNDGIPDWIGAQTTVQKWYADDTLDLDGNDRTLRTVFTHDHFGPSTHQQAGLYAGLVVEPQGSSWFQAETGVPMYTRPDGGPTSWQALIETADSADSYREFMFEFQDFALAYKPNDKQPAPYEQVARQPGEGFDDPPNAIVPPGTKEVGLPFLFARPDVCPGGVVPPCPELISAEDVGMFSVNYRNEPIALRVRNPNTNTQASGLAGDLSYAYSSLIPRQDPALNVQPAFYAPLTNGLLPTDPFTPLLRAYEDDDVQIRILVGAHEEPHNFTVHGMKWLFEPSDPNSGYRNSQMMGISEHFEFDIPAMPPDSLLPFADYLYKSGAAVSPQWTGNWGVVRTYRGSRSDLAALQKNPQGQSPGQLSLNLFDETCPKSAPTRNYTVLAVSVSRAVPGGTLVYNSRTDSVTDPVSGAVHSGPLNDPTAIMYVRLQDYNIFTGKLKSGVPVEPLILRAAAGECVRVTLINLLPGNLPDLDGFNAVAPIVDNFNLNQVKPSKSVGLHPQLVSYDVSRSDGTNVGLNLPQTAIPGLFHFYRWYAGNLKLDPNTNQIHGIPIEFGATNLMPSDPIKHTNKGAVGALIIEPEGSTWVEDYPTSPYARKTRAAATVTKPNGESFREFVLIFQTDLNLRYSDGSPVFNQPCCTDANETGQRALNYRTEPLWFRLGFAPESPDTFTRDVDFTNVLSNAQVGGDPETPLFEAAVGTPVRFRVLNPGGHLQPNVFEIHGHIWEEEPYTNDSAVLGHNPLSEWKGSQHGHGPSNHFDVLLKNGAGGKFGITGDFLYRDYVPFYFDGGLWGILRVTPSAP